MADNATRIADTRSWFEGVLDEAENDNAGSDQPRGPLSTLRRRFDLSIDALRSDRFDEAEQALSRDLRAIDRAVQGADTEQERLTALRRKAMICGLLGFSRLEQLDGAGARIFYRDARAALADHPFEVQWEILQRLGTDSRKFAELTGSMEAAALAIDLLREAIGVASDNLPDAQNNLGLALVELGERESDSTALEQAKQAYEIALVESGQSSNRPPSWRFRVTINLATVMWMLALRYEKPRRFQLAGAAADLLRAVLKELQPSPAADWVRAQDNLGNALAIQGKYEDAIAAHEAALHELKGTGEFAHAERVRCLGNAGRTLAEAGNYPSARERYNEALKLLSPQLQPLAYARTLHNLGDVLSRQSEDQSNRGELSEARASVSDAIDAFKTAAEFRRREWSPLDWAETTAGLATALLTLGLLEARSPSPFEASVSSDHFQQAITLYLKALPDLPIQDQNETKVNLEVAHICVKTLATDGRLMARSIFESAIFPVINMKVIVESIVDGMFGNMLQFGMSEPSLLTEKVTSILAAAGIHQDQWPAALADIAGRLSGNQPARPVTEYRGSAPPLPAKASELYAERGIRPELGRKENIVEFLDRVWGAYEVLGRPDLHHLDPGAEKALRNWLQKPGSKPPVRPKILKKSEVIDEQITDPRQIRQARKLVRAFDRRQAPKI